MKFNQCATKWIVIIELNLESAMVGLESTHVRIGPGFTSILGVFWSFFMVFSVLGGGGRATGGLGKKIISGIDRARLARLGIGNG